MPRRPAWTPPADDPAASDPNAGDAGRTTPDSAFVRDLPDLSSLGVAGLTRRRTAGLLGAFLAIWIVIVFARQVGDASAASTRVEQVAADNVAMSAQVAGLERELGDIQRQHYVEQQARAHGLGGSKEIAFTLAADAPPLAADAPGSASVRLGARTDHVSPLERWLTLLFGPGD
jgi:cell division protein FtsB